MPIARSSHSIASREELVAKAKERLLRHGLPRLQMSLILALTGAAGFFTSFVLLQVGLDAMAVRYPIAVLVAYAVFLLLLQIWLKLQRDGWEGDGLDLLEVPLSSGGSGGGPGGGGFTGGGGRFGGGGASSSYESPASAVRMPLKSSGGGGGGGGSSKGSGGGFSFSLDLDDGGFLVVIAIAAIAVAAFGAAIYLIWSAPILLAEVLVDGLIMTGLYRRLKRTEDPDHWMVGAVRRTWIPALVVVILFSFAGWLLQRAVPDARSIGGAWKAVSTESRP
jgi:hypothetical protein